MNNFPTAPDGMFASATGRTDSKKLFASPRERAFIPSNNMTPGYGPIEEGTVMAWNKSVAGNGGLLYPYVGPDLSDIATNFSKQQMKTFLIGDLAKGDTTCVIKLDDQYKYVVADELVIMEKDGLAEYLGPIISVVAGVASVVVTFTNAITAATFTTAKYANIYPLGSAIPSVSQADIGATDETLTVLLAKAVDFEFGDTLVACAPGVLIENLGTILSVALGSTTATITFSTAVTGATFTTANNTVVYALHGALSKAHAILSEDKNSGGGQENMVDTVRAPICYGGAMLYASGMWNLDAAGKKQLNMTDLDSARVKFP